MAEEKINITFVTGNKKKLEEVVAIFGDDMPFNLVAAKIDLPELQGDPEEVSREKALLAYRQLGCAVMVEDTSLCYNALGGLPGIYIKWFLEKIGHDGLNNLLSAYEDKSAYAQCIFSLCLGDGADQVRTFVGRTHGKIVPARGPSVFGWDPVFEVDGTGLTYAEMDAAQKNLLSHRYKSLALLKDHLVAHAAEIAQTIQQQQQQQQQQAR
eukprot:gene34936-42311_t